MTARAMRTRQQVDAEYAAAIADAMTALETRLQDAGEHLHAKCASAYNQYERAVSVAHRAYWQASQVARDLHREESRWAVNVTALGGRRQKAIGGASHG